MAYVSALLLALLTAACATTPAPEPPAAPQVERDPFWPERLFLLNAPIPDGVPIRQRDDGSVEVLSSRFDRPIVVKGSEGRWKRQHAVFWAPDIDVAVVATFDWEGYPSPTLIHRGSRDVREVLGEYVNSTPIRDLLVVDGASFSRLALLSVDATGFTNVGELDDYEGGYEWRSRTCLEADTKTGRRAFAQNANGRWSAQPEACAVDPAFVVAK